MKDWKTWLNEDKLLHAYLYEILCLMTLNLWDRQQRWWSEFVVETRTKVSYFISLNAQVPNTELFKWNILVFGPQSIQIIRHIQFRRKLLESYYRYQFKLTQYWTSVSVPRRHMVHFRDPQKQRWHCICMRLFFPYNIHSPDCCGCGRLSSPLSLLIIFDRPLIKYPFLFDVRVFCKRFSDKHAQCINSLYTYLYQSVNHYDS